MLQQSGGGGGAGRGGLVEAGPAGCPAPTSALSVCSAGQSPGQVSSSRSCPPGPWAAPPPATQTSTASPSTANHTLNSVASRYSTLLQSTVINSQRDISDKPKLRFRLDCAIFSSVNIVYNLVWFGRFRNLTIHIAATV